VNTAVESIRNELASVVGESRVVSDVATCTSTAVDGVTPASVIYSASAEQVAETLKYAADHELSVIPFRNGTKLGIGNVPRRYDLALSLKDLNRVWHYEPGDLTITVEAGMKLGDLHHFVARNRLWLPLDPAGGPRASIGGILAANACGPLRLRYGTPRDMVLGMKIATTAGKLIKTGGRVVKNVAGYDLGKLLIGSYGTLGVIVEASFKLFPMPAESATVVISVGTLATAREFRRRLLASPLTPMRVLMLEAAAEALVSGNWPADRRRQEFRIWVEAGGSAALVERHKRALAQLAKGIAASVEPMDASQAQANWTRVADLGTWLPGVVPDAIILQGRLPMAVGETFLERALEEGERHRVRIACFGQIAAGVISLCVSEAANPGGFALVNRLREVAQGLGGVLVVERCPAELKSSFDVWGPVGDDFEVMKKVKGAWDPKGILAPGRFVGGL
jgi:glycolate oxidase FAD binding subunit